MCFKCNSLLEITLFGQKQLISYCAIRCKLQVQVPEKGNIDRPEQLVGKNIVTSFTKLSENYFRNLESGQPQSTNQMNGVSGNKLRTRIKYVGGSVEAACALGVADGIVDLVGKNTLDMVKGPLRSLNFVKNPGRLCEPLA